MKLVLPLAFVGIVGSGCSKTYEIDGNQVKKNPFTFNNFVETKGEDVIKYNTHQYSNNPQSKGDISRLKINGIKYYQKDILVYDAGNKRYHYLRNKIDSINNVEKQKKIQSERERKEAQKQSRINYGLKALE